MEDPYTLPDEDPFSNHSSNPYLAYPDLPRSSIRHRVDSSSSYDLIEDDDIPAQVNNDRSSTSPRSFMSLPLFPFPLTPPKNKTRHSRSVSSSSTVTTHHHPTPPSLSASTPTPTTSKRRSFLTHFRHTASQSLSSVSDTLPLPPLEPPRPSFSSSTSSLRLFSSSSSNINSTSYSHSMSTTTFDSDSGIGLPDTPTKSKTSFFNSLRLPTSPNRSASNLSSADLASSTTHRMGLSPKRPYQTLSNIPSLSNIIDLDNDEDTNIDNLDFLPPPSNRFSRSSSQTSTSSSHLPSSSLFHLPTTKSSTKRERERVYFSSLTSRSGKKKRKLIISGIGASEFRKFEGIKRWCENFGELRSITRLPNGDLQIDFRDPEVADTVCRIRAKVFISGVGSVQLSWTVGNKR